MSHSVEPLEDLARRIAEQEAQLDALRREHESRQTRLAKLGRRKEELQAQLQELETAIAAVTAGTYFASNGSQPVEAATPVKTAPKKAAPSQPQAQASSRQPRMADLIVAILREAGSPLTSKQITDEVLRRGYATTSQNLPGIIKTRLNELVRKRVLSRTEEAAGWAYAVSANGLGTSSRSASRPAQQSAPEESKAVQEDQEPDRSTVGQSLPVLLTSILQKSRKPLRVAELTERVLAAGYSTKSANFSKNVSTVLPRMKNVENVAGAGYRLKNPRG